MKSKGMNRDKRGMPAPRLSTFIARGFGLLRRALKMGVIGGIGLLVPAAAIGCGDTRVAYGPPAGGFDGCRDDKDCTDKCGPYWYCDGNKCQVKTNYSRIYSYVGCTLHIGCNSDIDCVDICGPGWICASYNGCRNSATPDLNPAVCLIYEGDREADTQANGADSETQADPNSSEPEE